MRTNVAHSVSVERTHEGGIAKRITPEQQLRRSVCACMLWERGFYEDGVEVAARIASLVEQVKPSVAAGLAVEARTKMKLRHAPLWVACAMCASEKHRSLVAETLEAVIQRVDELTEFLSLYWLGGKKPLAAQAKKGLAAAFTKFNEFQFAKYMRSNTTGKISFRDVMFLVHPKPKDDVQADLWKRIANKEQLQTPDTWEVALSTGKDKLETWTRLIREQKLGGLAVLRNLRNMAEAGVSDDLISKAIAGIKSDRILPFRFIAAAKHAPKHEPELERAMLECIKDQPKFSGKTVLLVDVSGSMEEEISGKSDLSRMDAAVALAVLCREKCDSVSIYTFSDHTRVVPCRSGFALADAIESSQPHSSTDLGGALSFVNGNEKYDRIIVFTDEQSKSNVGSPRAGSVGYMINVATNKNGVGYGKWNHIDGFSEACIDYIYELEAVNADRR